MYRPSARGSVLRLSKGFTLVELLVVVTIIAILAVVGLVVFSNIQKSARDSRRRADIEAIAKAYEVKYNSNGSYQVLTDADFASGKPKDPNSTKGDYFNWLDSIGAGFKVCASLEANPNNACNTPAANCYCIVSAQETIDSSSTVNPSGSTQTGIGFGGSSASSCDPNGTLLSGLAGYWKMDETSWNGTPGEVVDFSGNGNNGRAINGAAITTGLSPNFLNAGSFDGINNGVNDYVDYGNPASLNITSNLSVAFWFKKTAIGWGGGRFPISKSVGTTSGWAIAQEWSGNNPLSLRVYAGDYRSGDIDTELNVWTHFVGTYDSTSGAVKLYKNGGAIVKSGTAPAGTTITSSPANLLIGRSFETPPMVIDDVRIYNRVLSDTEISSLYNSGAGCLP
ncbi:prepilin-type N-terminal cleavage/methylation domain-containing protein [Candidatus Daviesbacteria bacterium]|nr:prepilin-type N-terminal cleavage/methylation domain-containing protein [Candidatus Daviesbacteria bacterium]